MGRRTRINSDRFLGGLDELARFGAQPGGGITRPAWSADYESAANWLCARMRNAGLSVRRDGAGNIIGRLGGEGPAVVMGSHIDTVPNGGALDGALGVLAGIEAVECLSDGGVAATYPIEVVAFADEEGQALDLFGSRAMAGRLTEKDIATASDDDGRPLTDHLAKIGCDVNSVLSARRGQDEILAYLELHIEQGPELERRRLDVGIVECIPGIARCAFEFVGRQSHAGATSMQDRRDALTAAVSFMNRANQRFRDDPTDARTTFGVVDVSPNILNVVPGHVHIEQEVRALSSKICDAIRIETCEIAQETAAEHDIGLQIQKLNDDADVRMDSRLTSLIEDVARGLEKKNCRLPSWASHDCQIMATRWPSAMIFVPSTGGLSHHPDEHTPSDKLISGAELLMEVIVSDLSSEMGEGC